MSLTPSYEWPPSIAVGERPFEAVALGSESEWNQRPVPWRCQGIARALPVGAVIDISKGCHTGPFFAAAQPPSLTFLGEHLQATLSR